MIGDRAMFVKAQLILASNVLVSTGDISHLKHSSSGRFILARKVTQVIFGNHLVPGLDHIIIVQQSELSFSFDSYLSSNNDIISIVGLALKTDQQSQGSFI